MQTLTARTDARDRILVACMALQWMVAQLESMRAELDVVGTATTPESEAGSICRAAADEHRTFLDGIADRLTAVANDVGDYLNGTDAVLPQDEALVSPMFAILNRVA